MKIYPGMNRPKATFRLGVMNGTEELYSRLLDLRKYAKEIVRWDFEPEKLRLARETYYIPDFRVIMTDGTVEFHEVKIRYRNGKVGWRGDAKEKYKIAQELHPYIFRVAICNQGKWEIEEI